MKIGINARYLQNIHTGIANYLLNLILNLRMIDKKNEYILFLGSNKLIPKAILDKKFDYDIPKIHASNQVLKILWAHLYLPFAIKKLKLDIFHESAFVAPIFKNCKTITTIYDLAFLYFPHCYTFRNRLYFKSLLSKSIKQSDSIITISESSKKDIIDNFQVSPDKIDVIYPGVDETFHTLENKDLMEEVKKIYKIKKNFILTVSSITPRKNLSRLIKSFKLLKDEKKINWQLVIVGGKGWLYEDVFKEVSRYKLQEDIIFCGYVPQKHLLCLYNAASLFVYPSLYEGFGLPVLEAMACACPVVASNTSSMPEACADAALLVNPNNIEEFSSAINAIKDNSTLRQILIKKGLEQAKRFSWRRTAEKTLNAYIKVNSFTYK